MSKISFKKAKTITMPEVVPVEIGDVLTIWIDIAKNKSYKIQVISKTSFGEFPSAARQNYLFGTTVDVPGAVIRLDFKEGLIDYNGPDFFQSEHFSSVEYKGEALVLDPKNYNPCKTLYKKKFINEPVVVGDMLLKPSSSGYWKVVYVNDSCSAVVVENENTRKIELINFKDVNALDAYGLFWG